MAKITKEMINEINELARKSKTVGLTDEEKVRQQELRQAYLKEFRSGFKQQLQNIKDNAEDISVDAEVKDKKAVYDSE